MSNRDTLTEAFLTAKHAEYSLAVLNVRRLVARLLLAQARFPTEGEAYTFLARHQARLQNAEATLRATIRTVEARHDYRLVHDFWTAERLADLSQEARASVRSALDIAEADYYRHLPDYPTNGVTSALERHMAEDGPDNGTLRKAWRAERRARAETSRRAQAAAAMDAVKHLQLDELDEADLLADLSRPENADNPNAFLSSFMEANRAIGDTLKTLGLTTEKAFHASGHVPPLNGFQEAAEYLRTHPEDALTLTYEQAYAKLAHDAAEKFASDDPNDRLFLALPDGNLLAIGGKDRFARETAFRLVIDTLGLDPRRDAAFVTRREVGRHGPGYHYLYPTDGHTCIIGIPDRAQRPEVWACKGDLELAKRLLAERAHPVIGDGPDEVPFGEHHRFETELAQAGPTVPRNPFRRHPFDMEQIEAHFAARATLEGARRAP